MIPSISFLFPLVSLALLNSPLSLCTKLLKIVEFNTHNKTQLGTVTCFVATITNITTNYNKLPLHQRE